MPVLITPAGTLHYREQGRGAPLLLLHANPGESRDFDAVIPALAQRYRVIALDWPGYGQSSLPVRADAQTVLDLYAALLALIEGLDLPPVSIIGNSVGGNAAARLAALCPQRVRRLVLVAPGGFTPHNLITRSFCALQGSRFALSPRRFAALYLKARNEHTAAMLHRAGAAQASPESLALNRALWRSFATPANDLRTLARGIGAPTLLLFGQHDIAIPAHQDGAVAQRCIAHAQFAVMPCGHAPFAEVPELFLQRVLPFLADAPG